MKCRPRSWRRSQRHRPCKPHRQHTLNRVMMIGGHQNTIPRAGATEETPCYEGPAPIPNHHSCPGLRFVQVEGQSREVLLCGELFDRRIPRTRPERCGSCQHVKPTYSLKTQTIDKSRQRVVIRHTDRSNDSLPQTLVKDELGQSHKDAPFVIFRMRHSFERRAQ